MTFSGSGFTPREEVVITTDSTPAVSVHAAGSRSVSARVALAPLQITTEVDTAGKFSVAVTLAEAGTYTPTARGSISGITQTNAVRVEAAEAAGVAAQ